MAEMSGRKQKSKKKIKSPSRTTTAHFLFFFCVPFGGRGQTSKYMKGEGIKETHQESTTRGGGTLS